MFFENKCDSVSQPQIDMWDEVRGGGKISKKRIACQPRGATFFKRNESM
jgi:hypothetical protein